MRLIGYPKSRTHNQSVVRDSRNNVFSSNSQGHYANSRGILIDSQSRFNNHSRNNRNGNRRSDGWEKDNWISGSTRISMAMIAALAFIVIMIIAHTTTLVMTDLIIM